MARGPNRQGGRHHGRGGQGRGDQPAQPMTAPYRHIPISAFIHEPEWKDQVSQDHPLDDGVGGWLDITLTTTSDLMIGGEKRDNRVQFFTTPDGKKAVPGASIRGMLRSVLEIAAFGRAAFIDDARYPMRDLTGALKDVYAKRMTDRDAGGVIHPQSKAGWLRRRVDPATGILRWELQTCEMARVHVLELDRLKPGVEPGLRRRASAARRYQSWDRDLFRIPGTDEARPASYWDWSALERDLWVDSKSGPHDHQGGQIRIRYHRAYAGTAANPATKPGRIVFTGKSAEGVHRPADVDSQTRMSVNGKKKQEFFFHTRSADWIDVTHLKADFLAVHEPSFNSGLGDNPDDSWKHLWKAKFEGDVEIPVFYLEDDKQKLPSGKGVPVAMGLAMMFRLPHVLLKRDLLAHAGPRHNDPRVRDFATLMFGPLLDDSEAKAALRHGFGPKDGEKGLAFKGRVSCETLPIDHEVPGTARVLLLGAPKGQFFSAYVDQPRTANGTRRGGKYASYSPDTGEPEVQRPELAGRKRYPVGIGVPNQNEMGAATQLTTLHPVGAGTTFTGRVRFHNLKPEELGALVFLLEFWVPNWGPRPDLRHKIGMAKPKGYGECRIDITAARVETNDLGDDLTKRPVIDNLDAVRAYADLFARHMTEAFRVAPGRETEATEATWRDSEQIELLLALADPSIGRNERDNLRQMILQVPGENEFAISKSHGQIVPPYPRRKATTDGAGPAVWRDRQVFVRSTDTPAGVGGGPAFEIGARVELTRTGTRGTIEGMETPAPNQPQKWRVLLDGAKKATGYPESLLVVIASEPA